MISRHTFRKISILVLCIINLIFFIFEAYAGTVDTATLSPSSATINLGQVQAMTFSATNNKTFDIKTYHVELVYTNGLNISNITTNPSATKATLNLTKNLIILEWSNIGQGVSLTASFNVSSNVSGTYSISPYKVYYKDYNRKTYTGTCNTSTITISPDIIPPAKPSNIYSMSGDGYIRVYWDTNTEPDILGYDIYRSSDSITYTKIGTTQYHFDDTNVQNNVAYYYKIKAKDTSGNESEYSDVTAEAYLNIIIKTYDTSGVSVAAVGDINGDGKQDVVLGLPMSIGGNGKNNRADGEVDVYLGGNTTGTPDIIIYGEVSGDARFGYSLAVVDLNNDGYDDLVVGAPYYDQNVTWPEVGTAYDAGKVYVYAGGSQFSTTPVFTINGRHAIGCDGGCYYPLRAESLGFSIASVGDVNNDGYKDIAISAPWGGMDRTGSVMILLGGTVIADRTTELIGPTPFYSLAAAGDFNKDGYADVIAGAPNAQRAYLLKGGTNISLSDIVFFDRGKPDFGKAVSSLDINGDGYTDMAIASNGAINIYYGAPTLNNVPDIIFHRGTGGSIAFNSSTNVIASLGDINRDGYNDLVSDGPAVSFGSTTSENFPDIVRTGQDLVSSLIKTIGAGDIDNDGRKDVIAAVSNKVYVYSLTPYLSLPEIILTAPKDNEFTSTQNISIKGLVKGNIKKLLIAGQQSQLMPDSTFDFQLSLKDGKNVFEIIAEASDGRTVKRLANVTYRALPPLTVEITSPADGSTLSSSPVNVTGNVSDSTANVTVNNIIAIISGNTFQANVNLTEGANTITATAFDNYGRTATQSITVNFFTKGTITGTVTDSSTALPLSAVTVTVKDSLNKSYTTTTNSDGTYTVSNVTQGNFTATFTKTGFYAHTENGTLSAGQTLTLNVQLTPVPPPITLTITSPQDGAVLNSTPVTVTGTVHNTAGVGGSGESRAQSFKPATSGTLDSISLILQKVGTPDDNLYIKISTELGGEPIAVSNAVSSSSVSSSSPAWKTFYFSNPPTVTAGNTYYLELWREKRDVSNYIEWKGLSGFYIDNYPDGEFYSRDNGIWSGSIHDLTFRIYINNTLDVSQNFYDTIYPGLYGLDPYPVNVTVNGVQASVSNNTFSATVPLNEGQNTITATASDQYSHTDSDTINVTLVTKGNINGTVTDSSTGLPISSATVSVTDFSNNTQSTQTTSDGTYTINNIASGAFSGSITKSGYTTYNFSNTISPGQTITINATLSPIPPTISNIAVTNITSSSAIVTWTTDQMSDSLVEYGTTTLYGSSVSDSTLATSHSITLTGLTMGTTYHFRVKSTNSSGISSTSGDYTFTTSSPITITITSPLNGDTINKPYVMVKGAVSNTTGNETGVTVNGVVVTVYGNQFVVNQVPLVDGSNTITATATDTAGNTATTSITVNAVTTSNYIQLTANPESGIAPLEVTLRIDGSFSITSSTITYTGPAQPEFLSSSADEYRVRMTVEGIYYFTANVTGPDSNVYQDTVAVVVLNQATLDALLRAKWEAMKTALANQDVNSALNYYTEDSKQLHNDIFTALYAQLPQIVQNMQDIQLIYVKGSTVKYRIIKNEVYAGQTLTITYYIYFTRDGNGVWKIDKF